MNFDDPLYIMFSSGTTGKPKEIVHQVSKLLQDTKQKDKSSIWLYAYNPFHMDIDLWTKIQDEIKLRVEAEPSLGSFLYSLVLSQKDLIGAVASILASKLHSDALSAMDIKKFILEVYRDCEDIENNLEEDYSSGEKILYPMPGVFYSY